MTTLPETGFPFDNLSEEVKLIWMRLEKDGVDPTKLMVVVRTAKQLLPNKDYEFAVEEVEDADGKLVGIRLLVS